MYQKSEAHLYNAKQAIAKANLIKCQCQYCNKILTKANHVRHEKSCYLNPSNIRLCPVCDTPLKVKKSSTCSYSCSNKLFRTGPNNGNWKETRYQTTCFHYHKKECIICQEKNIVTVHHLDENRMNNHPENLIPLCPTHHSYWHSQYRSLIEKQVMNYITNWKNEQCQDGETRTHELYAPNVAE